MTFKFEKLGTLCLIEKGITGIQKAIPGSYPMVVTSEERKTHNEYQFDAEAVIIPLVSSTGHGHKSLKRIHFQKGKFALGSILCAVIPKDKNLLDAEYLYRYLDLNRENELVSRMRGMANVTLPIKEIADIEIPLPSLAVQRDFVKKYKQLEHSSNQLSFELIHQQSLLKQLRQAFLREAMQGKLVKQDKKDGNSRDLLEQIKAEKAKLIAEKKLKKEKPLPPIKPEEIPFEIPEGWVWCRLGEIISFGPSNGYSPRASKKEIGIKCLTLTATTSGIFKEQYYKLVDEEIPNDSYLWLSPGDILIQRGNSIDYVGIAALYEGEKNKFIYPDLMIKIQLPKNINPRFIHMVLISPFIRKYFSSNAFGAQKSMPKINQGVVLNTPIPLPPLSEQHKIVDKLKCLISHCEYLQQNVENSKGQNSALLQQALREMLSRKEQIHV